MATLSSPVYLLYTARVRFDSLTATLHYEYCPRTLRQLINEWRESRYGPQGTAYLSAERRPPPPDDKPVKLTWDFWLEKPDKFRHDISGGYRTTILIIHGEQSVAYGGSTKPQGTAVKPSAALTRAEEFLFIDPSPLLAAHDLTQPAECSFLDREALRFRAIPRTVSWSR